FVAAISPVMRGCDLQVQLFADGLLPAMLRAAQQPATEESERLKYEQIWEVDDYRRVSPGAAEVGDAIRLLDIGIGASVADFGCGTGRATQRFIELGCRAVGVDIASNCLEEDVPFVQAALWDAAKLPRVEYGCSVDVLEHIPPEKVEATLRAIHDACTVGVYLNIDTIPDSYGVRIGKRLHLTVQPAPWWEEQLRRVWRHVELIRDDGRQAVFVC